MSSSGIPEHRRFLRYALAVASVALAMAITLALRGPSNSTPLFVAAILFTAWYGGGGPGLLSATLATLAVDYYFTPPYHSLLSATPGDAIEIATFAVTTVAIVGFIRAQRSARTHLGEAEAALRRSEAHLAEAQRLSQIGSWVWDAAAGKLTHSSEEHARLLGLDLGATRSFGAWRDRIHPEDRERVLHVFDDAVRQRMNCQLEYRVVRPDGSMSYIQSVGHAVLDSSGELVELVGTDMDVTERRRAEQERQEHLHFFENMDRVNRAIQGTHDLERMMSDVLHPVLESFRCDRAWLVYPCDPQAESWRAVMEHTRPQFPGAFAVGTALPVDAEVAKVFSSARASSDPVVFGPACDREVPAQVGQRYSIQSIMAMAIYPMGDQPYLFGLHQCSYPRAWTPAEERLFREIGRRLTDALTSLLTFRNLQESQARLKEAQRIAHLGYFTREVDTGNYTLSEEIFRIVGLEPQDGPVPFNTLWAVIHPEDRQREKQLVEEAITAGRPYDVECRVVLPSGEVRIVQTRGSPQADESGRVRRVFGIMQDITERKRAEEALQQAQSQLAHVTRMVTLGELTASIAHEVNQPLAAVVANGNACRRWLEAVPPNLDEAREALQHIISNGNRASDVVRRIRGLLQRQTPEKERIEVNELVRGALALTRNELARQQVLVRTELSPDLPTIVADRGGLEQVLVNLILNAIDAMTGASEPKVLTVASRVEGSAVRVEVRDRGKGCDPEQLRRMFEPFYSTKGDGLGMGLAISRSIVEAHAGQLWASPNDDAGLTLQFTLTAPAGNGA